MTKTDSKVIVCHLGNGSSISAVQNGKCVDTTMGLTPLEGVVMGTRSGNIDPAIVEFIAKKENLDIAGVMNVLNKKSGLQGMSGVGSDMRDIRAAIADGNEDAKNAYDVLCYGIAKFVGGYVAAMNGVDAIVFTAGIGENVGALRKLISCISSDTLVLRLMTKQMIHSAKKSLSLLRLPKLRLQLFLPMKNLQSQRYSSFSKIISYKWIKRACHWQALFSYNCQL